MSVVSFPSEDKQPLNDTPSSGGSSIVPNKNRTSSFPEATTSSWIQGLFQSYAGLGYSLPFEILSYIELISTYNPDFSQAVDNVRTLANSGHELFVDAQAPRTAARIKSRLEEKSRLIQEPFGGIDGLVDKLLDQAAVYGACCGEWILSEDLTDVVDFQDVNPKNIRFFWDVEFERYIPFQKVNAAQLEIARQRGQEIRSGCVKLNESTFRYYAFDSMPGSPYGTPPFLAALANIAIQRDMVGNMAQIVKKVGLLGMIDISVKALPPKPGEQNDAYQSRAKAFLNEYVSVLEAMVRDGGIAHFDDVEVETYQLAGNAAGATNIFKQNEELIFSGLKSMPSVQGRCVHPDTKVLTSNLEWVRAGDLVVGEELIGFDEDLGKGRGHGAVARMKPSTVECNDIIKLPCVRVVTDKGEIVVSRNHPFVTKHRSQTDRVWRNAEDLAKGDKLIWFGEPWETDKSYESGYLAGIFDGEGCVSRSGSGQIGMVTMAQLPGAVLDETIMALKWLGFEFTCGAPNEQSGVCHLRLRGGKFETLRFLGTVRPHRLIAKAEQAWNGASLRNGGSVNQSARKDIYATVKRVENLGVRRVVALQTSSRTFFSEGLLSHNSYSSTETYAGVAYDIIIRNTYKYQRAVKRMIEAGYWLMVTLWGETPDAIRLVFNSNKSLHRLQDAQAFRLEIFNAVLLWVLGIWNQQDVAQALGEQDPKVSYDTVPESPLLGAPPTVGISAKEADGEGTVKVSAVVRKVLAALSEVDSEDV